MTMEQDNLAYFAPDRGLLLLSIIVPGEPVPQGSKKWVGRMVDDNAAKLRPWRSVVAAEIKSLNIEQILGPVHCELTFYFTRPHSHWGTGRNATRLKTSAPEYKKTKPDLDKLCRSVFDAMQDSGLIRDDGQIAVLIADKKYGQTPGVWIRVRPLS